MNYIEQLKKISAVSSVSKNLDTNLTAKQKAQQLVDSFYVSCPIKDITKKELMEVAITCAVITADELISVSRSKYWYDVKDEILKLK